MNWVTISMAPRYEVSDGGAVRVKSTGKVLKPFVDRLQDYPRVDLWNGSGKRLRAMVHILVMAAFRGEKPEGMEIDHINCDRADNRLENLRYVTPEQNMENPNTRRNRKLGNVKMLVTRGFISKEEGIRRIGEILEGYGNQG